MMGFRLVTAVLASVLTLAATACSTTDVLTPVADFTTKYKASTYKKIAIDLLIKRLLNANFS